MKSHHSEHGLKIILTKNLIYKTKESHYLQINRFNFFCTLTLKKLYFLYITYIHAQYFNPCRFDCKDKITEYFQNYLAHSKLSPFHFHLKICDFQKKPDNFHILLNELNITWNVIAITTWRITGAGEAGEQGGHGPPK